MRIVKIIGWIFLEVAWLSGVYFVGGKIGELLGNILTEE